ncbi:hypothetical protein [Vagococcus jeotgali]|uniref:hypothetical protein n=1 Tax=Vagococcus jeotgali TaxID=3109030 RepID=UPI002DD7BB60|nr:hypothetical protein [Vagococcus sp. B2T-5]
MLRQNLYVHLDGISNSVLTKGFTHEDFYRYTVDRPKNILLLNPDSYAGEYETHTGFRVIRGKEDVAQYLSNIPTPLTREVKWLDFEDYEVLKRLTANEIAEILYLSHMKTQLRSPFFYKLQNNYAYLGMLQNTTKIYYRHIDEFYQALAQKISEKVLYQMNSNRLFFSKKIKMITPLPSETVANLKSVMQEGVVFDFARTGVSDGGYTVPIHIVEDNLRKIDSLRLSKDDYIGTLTYANKSGEWQLNLETFEELYLR